MNETLNKFTKQKNEILKILEKVNTFLEAGEKLGVEIDNSIKLKLLNAISTTKIGKLKVALIGGFSEGKTSIAAAWMEKLDKSSMKITHQESSDEVKIYQVEDNIELIDTPGLFGFKEKYNTDSQSMEKYKEITQKYISEAHLVLYVMSSLNPIKESHNEDLNWLFRTLNLLPRTIFVLSKFDDITNIEDESSYEKDLHIKKENVLDRLKDLIHLSKEESLNVSIVAVSANPFDMGMEHWLSNMNQFKQLSHISSLQKATSKKIEINGGAVKILNETRKTIIQDVLGKQLPISQELNESIVKEIDNLSDISDILKKDIKSIEPKINTARINLKTFISDYFTDLILQLRGTSLETIGEFTEKEIGSEGIISNTKIQNEFEQEIGIVSLDLEKIEINFNAEISTLNKSIRLAGKQGISYLSKSGLINSKNVIIARDTIVKGAKLIGKNLALKFKPYGAIKFAKGANVALAVVGVALELWDSYDKHKKAKEFEKAQANLKEEFEKQREEMINMINEDSFIDDFFPSYSNLNNDLESIQDNISKMRQHQEDFKKWEEMGEVIDVEFSEI